MRVWVVYKVDKVGIDKIFKSAKAALKYVIKKSMSLTDIECFEILDEGDSLHQIHNFKDIIKSNPDNIDLLKEVNFDEKTFDEKNLFLIYDAENNEILEVSIDFNDLIKAGYDEGVIIVEYFSGIIIRN